MDETVKKVKRPQVEPQYPPSFLIKYDQVIVPEESEKEHIYSVNEKPVDFDSGEKMYNIGMGVNPAMYQKTNFSLKMEDFYEELFSYRAADD